MAPDEEQGALSEDAIREGLFGSHIRPMTARLIENLLLDRPLTIAQCDDFGVETPDHYRALRAVFETDDMADLRKRSEELDQALGSGKTLTKLVHTYAPAYRSLTFQTVWDELHL